MARKMMAGLLLVLALAMAPAMAQEHAEEAGHEEPQPPLGFKWMNFGILVAGVGYLVIAKGMPALGERGHAIEKALKAAEQIKADAAAEEAAIDRKMAGLKGEIEALRTSARKEMEAERERFSAETRALVAKLQANAESEIATMAKQSEIALKAKASELALDLARQKVAGRMDAQTGAGLVTSFVNDLKNLQEARN